MDFMILVKNMVLVKNLRTRRVWTKREYFSLEFDLKIGHFPLFRFSLFFCFRNFLWFAHFFNWPPKLKVEGSERARGIKWPDQSENAYEEKRVKPNRIENLWCVRRGNSLKWTRDASLNAAAKHMEWSVAWTRDCPNERRRVRVVIDERDAGFQLLTGPRYAISGRGSIPFSQNFSYKITLYKIFSKS